MSKSTTTRPKSKREPSANAKLKNAKRNLDEARSERDPNPERVLVALLGWQGGIRTEINQVRELIGKFRKMEDLDFRPRFEFLLVVLEELGNAEQSFDNWPRPCPRSAAELAQEVNGLLPTPDRDENGGAA